MDFRVGSNPAGRRAGVLMAAVAFFAGASAVYAGTPIISVKVLAAPMNANSIRAEVKIDPDGETVKFYRIYVVPKEGGLGAVYLLDIVDTAKAQKKDFEKLKAAKYDVFFEVGYDAKPDGSYRSVSKKNDLGLKWLEVTGAGGDKEDVGALKGTLGAAPGIKVTAQYTPPKKDAGDWKLKDIRFVARRDRPEPPLYNEKKADGGDYANIPAPDRGDYNFWVYADVYYKGEPKGKLMSGVGFAKIP